MSALQYAEVCEETDTEERYQDPADAILKRLEELDLPAEDGIPLESNWHRIEMNLLIDSVHYLWRDRNDYFAGGNMFIYFSVQQVKNRDYRGPDFFVVKDTDGTRNRDSWITWEEIGRYPDVIVELASPTTIKTDLGFKKHLYERTFRTREYFCYDPDSNRLFGWRLTNKGLYTELKPNDRGWLWSEELSVWVGTWTGEFQRHNGVWLRFYSDMWQLVLTHKEAEAQRAEQEAQRAEQEAQRAEQETRRVRAAEAEINRLRALLKEQGIEP
ncbi:MAG: hypothetical protein GY795_05715 [Desulfobacterales bacterium]|nr:hypothetical protein [Desulfobacterales bacterium]